MQADTQSFGPLYRALLRRAEESPGAPALADANTQLDYAETLHEVDCRAAAMEPWAVLDEQAHGKLAFALDYLAAAKRSVPVVISDGTGTATAIGDLLRARPDEVRALGLTSPEVMFTSGSSSRAKAVLLDGHRMYDKALQINAFVGNPPRTGTTEVLTLPLRHSFGLGRLRCALAAGQSVRLAEGLDSPDGVFAVADKYPTVGLALIATQAKILLNRYPGGLREFANRITYVEIGSEPLESDQRRALAEVLPTTRLAMHYGMTELSRAAMVDLNGPAGAEGAGPPLPDVELAFASDAENPTTPRSSTSGPSEGEILLRGAAMLKAYVDETSIQPVTSGTWLRTGDHGYRASDGSLMVEGRLSNVVKILGKKVAVEETEQALRGLLPGSDCVCVPVELVPGVTTLVALIETDGSNSPTPADLHRELSAVLPPHQVPRRFVTAERLPRLPGGKIDRHSAADRARRRQHRG